jgi:hypothetical protein
VASDEHEALREEIARQEGVSDAVEDLKGRDARELRANAIRLRLKLGRPSTSPSIESAVAERERRRQAQAKRLWGES